MGKFTTTVDDVMKMFKRVNLSSSFRMRVRSDGSAVPRHKNGADSLSPTRAADQPPRVMPRPCSPHKMAVSRAQMDSPEKRRLTTFGSAGCINHPDRKAFVDSHSQRSSPSTTRHASLGDHKALEAEALAEVSISKKVPNTCLFEGWWDNQRKQDKFTVSVLSNAEKLLEKEPINCLLNN